MSANANESAPLLLDDKPAAANEGANAISPTRSSPPRARSRTQGDGASVRLDHGPPGPVVFNLDGTFARICAQQLGCRALSGGTEYTQGAREVESEKG